MNKIAPVRVGGIDVGGDRLTVIAGPCLAESADVCLRVGSRVQEICSKLGVSFIFKASFDKANRTSGRSVRGYGADEGLGIIERVRSELSVAVTTDIHLPEQACLAAEVVDLLQIPAFLCRQTDLLLAAAKAGKPVNVKKGQFLAPWDAKNIVDKLRDANAAGVILTERGASFGYNALVVDMPGIELMRGFGVPVCFDATHSAQRPGGAGSSTAGNRASIPAMARAAAAVGIDAIFLEVHPDPANALSDPETQWPLDGAEDLLVQIAKVDRVARDLLR